MNSTDAAMATEGQLIQADFTPLFRWEVRVFLKTYGYEKTMQHLLQTNLHPSFCKAIVRNIMRKEGW